jgi:LysM repeat protein
MLHKRIGSILPLALMVAIITVSACTQSFSQAPQTTATQIPTSLFVSPFPTAENPMSLIESFATGTAVALTSAATTGTPATPAPKSATRTPKNSPTPGSSAATPTSQAKPSSYTLHKGEFPYCIARRFNINPNELMSLNGISSGSNVQAGMTLKIPQTGNRFPGDRSLHNHPATYTVSSSSETIYSVACYYGDIDPEAIASWNNLKVSASLSAGQKLQIP